jgi:hypothetical protein
MNLPASMIFRSALYRALITALGHGIPTAGCAGDQIRAGH